MHTEAKAFIAKWVHGRVFARVLEFGSLNINGSVRDVIDTYDDECYFGVDLQDGPGVDEVIDAVAYRAAAQAELVVCCEVLEHATDMPGIIRSAWENLQPGGVLLITCAMEPRDPHSAVDGGPLQDGEHYENVDPEMLVGVCRAWGFVIQDVEVHPLRGDLYMRAKKP